MGFRTIQKMNDPRENSILDKEKTNQYIGLRRNTTRNILYIMIANRNNKLLNLALKVTDI
jgi:hypothetical protein